MKRKGLLMFFAGAILMAGLAVSPLAMGAEPSQNAGFAPSRSGPFEFLRLVVELSDLNVTAEQKTVLRNVVKKYWQEAKPVFKELNTSRKEIRGIIEKTPLDEAQIRSAILKRTQTAGDLAILRARMTSEVRAILTPEQREKIRALMHHVDERLESIPDKIDAQLNHE